MCGILECTESLTKRSRLSRLPQEEDFLDQGDFQRSTLTDSPRSRDNIHFSTHNGVHKGNKQRSEYVQEERDTGRGVTKRRGKSRRRPYRGEICNPTAGHPSGQAYKQLATIGKLYPNYATTYATNYAKNYGTICATFYATSYDTNYATTYATNYTANYAIYYATNYATSYTT
ncbi:hypothetical protein J6590_053472 [Homalodisca vitripennis]|nr:hypothetical protein J6590_053472 [Homalodisca vitripennis]